MATFAVGDVQGCDATLGALLDQIAFEPTTDRLWLVGDLVNRGPDSLGVLRRVRALGDAARVVLGNHDLHLLACFAGTAPRNGDTLDAVLAAPDASELCDWLRQHPIVHREGGWLMVHAGLLPRWDLTEVERRADRVHRQLRGPDWRAFVRALRRDADGVEAETVSVLTRVRMLDADGRPAPGHKGPPETAPSGQSPWYAHSALVGEARVEVLFGHWAALGVRRLPGATSLDSGCVWGNRLTALRLDDGALFDVPLCDRW